MKEITHSNGEAIERDSITVEPFATLPIGPPQYLPDDRSYLISTMDFVAESSFAPVATDVNSTL